MTSTNLMENKSNLKCMDREVTEESLLNNLYKLEYYLIDLEFVSFINHTEYDELHFIENSFKDIKKILPFVTKQFYDINYVLLKNKIQLLSTEFLSADLEEFTIPKYILLTEIEVTIFNDLFKKLMGHELNLATFVQYLSYKYKIYGYTFYDELLKRQKNILNIFNYDKEGNYLLSSVTEETE